MELCFWALELSLWESSLCVLCMCVCLSVSRSNCSVFPAQPLTPARAGSVLSLFLYCVCVCVRAPVHAHPFSHSVVSDSLRPHGLTVPHQSPLSMAFSRQEYWIGLPFPTPGNLPKPGMEAETLASSALAGKFFTTVPPGKPISLLYLPLM